MKIVLIGAGNVATHLGIALQKAGCLILQVYSRTEESASALADTIFACTVLETGCSCVRTSIADLIIRT